MYSKQLKFLVSKINIESIINRLLIRNRLEKKNIIPNKSKIESLEFDIEAMSNLLLFLDELKAESLILNNQNHSLFIENLRLRHELDKFKPKLIDKVELITTGRAKIGNTYFTIEYDVKSVPNSNLL